jgi:predicted ATPase
MHKQIKFLFAKKNGSQEVYVYLDKNKSLAETRKLIFQNPGYARNVFFCYVKNVIFILNANKCRGEYTCTSANVNSSPAIIEIFQIIGSVIM